MSIVRGRYVVCLTVALLLVGGCPKKPEELTTPAVGTGAEKAAVTPPSGEPIEIGDSQPIFRLTPVCRRPLAGMGGCPRSRFAPSFSSSTLPLFLFPFRPASPTSPSPRQPHCSPLRPSLSP